MHSQPEPDEQRAQEHLDALCIRYCSRVVFSLRPGRIIKVVYVRKYTMTAQSHRYHQIILVIKMVPTSGRSSSIRV